tara:strand:- start:4913 stop:5653 length:741 start_codon:yes stop_codon:yes gene_type:complete
MKILFILIFSFSTILISQEYEFEPIPNKAEYYSGKYNSGKDLQDLLKWADKFVDWTEGRSSWDVMETVVFTPYYIEDLQKVDFVWLNLWPNASLQYKAIEDWIRSGGKIFSSIPVTNHRVVDVWQWPISVPEGERSDIGFVRFTDCSLKEGITMREAFDVYMRFAIKAKSTGDNMGRKMIMAPVGSGNIDFDYVYSLYANSPSEYGRNVDNFGENLQGTPEVEALNEISECSNGRIYSTVRVKQSK